MSYLPDLGGSKRCTSAFSSGPGRDAAVPSVDGVHVHCLDKLKCSAYLIFIDNLDQLAEVISNYSKFKLFP